REPMHVRRNSNWEIVMLSFLYIIIATAIGWQITDLVITKKDAPGLNLVWVRAASSFGVGVLVLTWPLYLAAYILHVKFSVESPLTPANAIVLTVALVILILANADWLRERAFGKIRKNGEGQSPNSTARNANAGLVTDFALLKKESIFYIIVLAFVWFSFHYVLHMEGTNLKLGHTVLSDYSPNIALIRSFSWFTNYPTEYPYFAGQDIKYHFMFMFFTGNMEYLGLPMSFAYNLTSTLSLFGFFIMLTQLALRITGRFAAAVLTALFFTFRSGLAIFMYIREHLAAGDLLNALATNTSFIGYTTHEEWGFWNYNVYLNQRHLGFGLIIATTVIWYFFGYVEEACGGVPCDAANAQASASYPDLQQESCVDASCDVANASDSETIKMTGNDSASEDKSENVNLTAKFSAWFTEFFLSKKAWLPKAPDLALVSGIILGLCSFWNGACVIGGLLILAGFAIFSKNKIDYVILAVFSVLLASLQAKAFIFGSAVSPTLYFGFISDSKSITGMMGFLAEMAGLTIVGSLAAAFVVSKKEKVLIAACWLPILFSFSVSLTPDVAVNHKYIMMVMAYLSIIWAGIVTELFSGKKGDALLTDDCDKYDRNKLFSGKKGETPTRNNLGGKVLAVLVAILMTVNGLYDYTIILRGNDRNHCMTLDTNHDLTVYIRENLTYDDMVLSGLHAISELTATGIRIYCGWPYYAWSAGYDTDYRCDLARRMYTEMGADEIRTTMENEGITHVLYEKDMVYDDIPAREEPFEEICDLIFASSDGRYRLYKLRENS
ncbi:MAG: hypothetical protein Q4A32_02140, partial [Lachnospiraceae bacterium]|nr:hypothetical protein [Lachnospiraceae bacterium]